MKKRLLIHAPLLTTPGGKQTYYSAVRKHFKSETHFFFYGPKGKKESMFGVIKRLLIDYYRFYQLAKGDDINIVLLNPSLNPKSFYRDSIFALIAALTKSKLIVFWRGWDWDFEKKTVSKIRYLFNFSFGRADAMIVLANEFKDRLIAYGFKGVIYCETTTVDDSILEFATNDQAEIALGSSRELQLLFLARIERNKGIYETLASFQRLVSKDSNLKLTIAGTGKALEESKKYVMDHQIPNVSFTGWISGRQKAKILNESDIYVFPSYHGEGMPNSVLESMASGLAVVTTDVGGIKDFFQPGMMGAFVSAQDTDDLTRKLTEIINNRQRLREIADFNRNYAREHFAPAKVADRLERIFLNTLAGEPTKKEVLFRVSTDQ